MISSRTIRVVLWLCLVAAVQGVTVAQQTPVEAEFRKNLPKYTREHLAVGEDATSGYDYLYYKSGDKIVRIRSIWSASYTRELRVEDLYFKDGDLVLVKRWSGAKRDLSRLKRGQDVALGVKEEMHFDNSKLTKWIENRKEVERSDGRWTDTEKQALEHARGEIEMYALLKQDNR